MANNRLWHGSIGSLKSLYVFSQLSNHKSLKCINRKMSVYNFVISNQTGGHVFDVTCYDDLLAEIVLGLNSFTAPIKFAHVNKHRSIINNILPFI